VLRQLKVACVRVARIILDVFFLPVLILAAGTSRFAIKKIDVGLGPLPLINSISHKQALIRAGFSAETYCDSVWHIISDFDIRFDKMLPGPLALVRAYFAFVWSVFRYKVLYISFSGGALHSTPLLAYIEPYLTTLADIKVVILPYGSDVYRADLCPDSKMAEAMDMDYPNNRVYLGRVRRKVESWSRHADYVVSGCDWVDYMQSWDLLMLSHFAIDTVDWSPSRTSGDKKSGDDGEIRILHAPNHRALKGTSAFLAATEKLKSEGYRIQVVLLEKASNFEVRNAIESADIVVDQLVIGWYAMFSIEAMAMGRPVVCYLREDLLEMYEAEQLIDREQLPIVSATPDSIYDVLKMLIDDAEIRKELSTRGPWFVDRYHSICAIGKIFEFVNAQIGLKPAEVT